MEFDIYEMRIKQTGDQNNIQHLPAWRAQSDKKIVASIANKTQRRAVKKYLEKVEKGNLIERMCIINEFTPKDKRKSYKQASSNY